MKHPEGPRNYWKEPTGSGRHLEMRKKRAPHARAEKVAEARGMSRRDKSEGWTRNTNNPIN